MNRKTRVIGFSLPPELAKKFEAFASSTHKTKSEFFRELINDYEPGISSGSRHDAPADLATSLRSYWQLKSKMPQSVIVVGLGLVSNANGKILIVARKPNDPIVPTLSWAFPGGELKSLELADETKQRISERLGLIVKVSTLITVRLIPESMQSDTQVIALYFACKAPTKTNITIKEPYTKAAWVKPLDVFKYFTSSSADEVTRYLATI